MAVGIVTQKARETTCTARDVYRMEKIGEDLADFLDNVVSWGARDDGEVHSDVGEEGFCFLRGGHGNLGKAKRGR